ncbi:YwhD family protein [Shimazuella sp. AN120528]|uniref:YwhD family protein n=1 Tax=Shimazuella soli TaxID=1892854 RepID=UPI001F115688|nr:YwhD family protein [Shimazuella soli]MCH5585085.1 YwhD family protein [Shimazuella soli]
MDEKKQKPQFQIVTGKSTTHGAYHTGVLNLSNLSALWVNKDQAKIDLGLIHAKSALERGIKFTTNKDEVDGELYWVVWVAVDRNEHGPYYAGVAACPMIVNKETRKGWKNLAHHVNRMDDALKRKIRLDELDQQEKKQLKDFLIKHDPSMWENSTVELKTLLAE